MKSTLCFFLLAILPTVRAEDLPRHAMFRFEASASLPRSPVNFLCFTPDGKRLIYNGDETGLGKWTVATGKFASGLLLDHASLHGTGARVGAMSRDATTVAVARYQSVVVFSLRDLTSAQELSASSNVNAVALSPDGKTLATGSDDNAVQLSELKSGKLLHGCKGHDAYVSALAFDPSGKLLASGGHDRTIRIWDAATGKQMLLIEGHRDQVSGLVFLSDGKTLASSSWDRTARLWEVKSGKELRRFNGHRLSVMGLSLSGDGKRLATASLDGTARLWDVDSGKELRKIDVHPDGVHSVALTDNGKTLATGDEDHTICLWSVATGRRLDRVLGGSGARRPRSNIQSIALSADLKRIVTGGNDGTVRLFDANTGKELRRLGRQHDTVWGVAFSPDGKHVASVGRRDGTVHLWDVEKGGEARRLTGQKGGITRVVWSRDGKRLVAAGGSFDPSIYVWDVAAEKVLLRLVGHKTYVDGIALSPDEKWLASASRDGTVRLWDLTTGKELKQFTGAGGACACVAFSPDGRTLAAGATQCVCRWDVASGKQLQQLEGNLRRVVHIAFLRDGRSLFYGAPHGFELLDLLTEQVRQGTGAMGAGIECLAFDPAGRRVVTADREGNILLWDPTGLQGRDQKTIRPDDEELMRRWQHLAKGPVEAYEAIWKLSVAPGQALPLFEKHLQPAQGVPGQQIARWVADLESDKYRVRDQATRELEKIGDLAEGELQRALKTTKSLDARRRIEQLLHGLTTLSATPEQLRRLRAVETLEIIGSMEARKLLERLAGGFPGARLTREAKATLERLKQ